MPDFTSMQGRFESDPANVQRTEGQITEPLDPLALDIPDDELNDIVDDRVLAIRHYNESELDLYSRRKETELYYFGKQVHEKEKEHELKNYESRYHDNVLYEIEATIKPLAMSRLPDLLVTPGQDNDQDKEVAESLSKVVDTEIKERNNRNVLGLAFRHLPVYFVGVIKARWNPKINDYCFEVIHPDLMDLDNTCTTNNADDMDIVAQLVPLTIQEIVMRFPKKKAEFFKQLKTEGLIKGDEPSWSQMATKLDIREVWFTWYKQAGEKDEWERIEGVLWKYKTVILKKMKNPNFDYEGETRYFAYDDMDNPATKRALNNDDMMQMLSTGNMPDNIKEEQVYHNYFDHPRKPYFFMGYDKWGRQPLDETSRVEQNLQNQKALDKRGKQIEETLNLRGHNVFSKEAGLTPADIEELDMNDPDEDLVVEGNVTATHKYIEPPRPAAQEFTEMTNIRERMYAVSGSNSVRGEIKSNAPATSNQIAREADFTRADDLVEDTINAAAQWMADYALQFIKLRYTQDHFKQILGVAGQVVFIKLNRNMVSDGMIVKIKASGTDKFKAQNNAMDMAKLELVDPYTFFKDMGLDDPEGRTEKLILAKTDPVAYLSKVIKGLNTSEALAKMLAQEQMPSPPAQQPMQPAQNPVMGDQNAMQPQVPVPPQAPPMAQPGQPTPGNTGATPPPPQAGPPPGSPRIL